MNGSLIRLLAALALVGSLSGCASLSKSECLSADWEDIGIRDGANGQPEEYLIQHAKACSKVHVVPDRGRLQQLASGPAGCEVCGCEFTPDGRTLFLSIQHPGEGGRIDEPISHWPDGNGLPARSALIAIEREDGLPV